MKEFKPEKISPAELDIYGVDPELKKLDYLDSEAQGIIDGSISLGTTRAVIEVSTALFQAARVVNGIRKINYATALKKLKETHTADEWQEILKALMTNNETIEELVRQGVAEINLSQKIKDGIKGLLKRKS